MNPLRDLKIQAGDPSYAALKKQDRNLARSTLSDALLLKTPPSLGTVLGLVAACAAHAAETGVPLPESDIDPDIWRGRWEAMRRALDAPEDEPLDASLEAVGAAGRRAVPAPSQLPRGGVLIGRDRELDRITELVLGADPAERPDGALVVIEGPPGVGKTSLALRWGLDHRQEFPDGQLFVDLRGFGPGPERDPASVLSSFLGALRADTGEGTVDVDELAAAYRSAVADRRLLVVLDNAASAEQLRPLVAAAPGVAVIATSRARLSSLAVTDGAERIEVGVLAEDDAVALLARRLGDRVPRDLAHVARSCGLLPFALRVVAERLARGRSADPLAREPDEDERMSVANVLEQSVERLPAGAAEVLATLGVLPVLPATLEAVAATVGRDLDEVAADLQVLAGYYLAQVEDRRVHAHDLVREFAGARVPDRDAVLARWVLWCHDALVLEDRLLLPTRGTDVPRRLPGTAMLPLATYDGALAWMTSSLPALVTVVTTAEALGLDELACACADLMLSFFNIRKAWVEWVAVFQVAVRCADRLGDPAWIGRMRNGLGIAHRELGDNAEAGELFTAAAAGFEAAGDDAMRSMVLNNLGTLSNETGHARQAIVHYEEALRLLADGSEPRRTAIVLHNLAEAELNTGEYASATGHAEEAIALCEALGDRGGEGAARTCLGSAQLARGESDAALASFAHAIRLQESTVERQGAAFSRHRLGLALVVVGRRDEGVAQLRAALAALDDLGDPHAARVRKDLADAEAEVA